MEEKVNLDHVSCNKTKKSKLSNTSSSPIKTTQLEQDSNGSHDKQSSNYSPLLKSNGVTAVMAKLFIPTGDQPGQKSNSSKYKSKHKKTKPSSKKVQKPWLIKVLLDSGSDGDLLFQKKGTPKYFPYLARQVPETWCT
jgi:vesicle coat complex subunit